MSSTRVLELESGNFRAIHWPEAPGFGAFWRLARVKAKGDWSAQGAEPEGRGKLSGIRVRHRAHGLGAGAPAGARTRGAGAALSAAGGPRRPYHGAAPGLTQPDHKAPQLAYKQISKSIEGDDEEPTIQAIRVFYRLS
jgi:hypothetical protein